MPHAICRRKRTVFVTHAFFSLHQCQVLPHRLSSAEPCLVICVLKDLAILFFVAAAFGLAPLRRRVLNLMGSALLGRCPAGRARCRDFPCRALWLLKLDCRCLLCQIGAEADDAGVDARPGIARPWLLVLITSASLCVCMVQMHIHAPRDRADASARPCAP